MDWSGQVEYAKAGWKSFEVDGEEAGLTTGYGPLQFLKVLLPFSLTHNIGFKAAIFHLLKSFRIYSGEPSMNRIIDFPEHGDDFLVV